MGLEWIFHVDDDELLYFDTPFSRIVDGLAPGVTCIVLVNIEAVPKNLAPECVFEDIEVFTQHKMLAYRNGKSAGRVADSDWHGPHRFTGSYHVVPVARACVLHFESCIYEQWRNKFIKHREIEEQARHLPASPRTPHISPCLPISPPHISSPSSDLCASSTCHPSRRRKTSPSPFTEIRSPSSRRITTVARMKSAGSNSSVIARS